MQEGPQIDHLSSFIVAMMKERKGSLHDRLYQMGKEKLRTQKSEASLLKSQIVMAS